MATIEGTVVLDTNIFLKMFFSDEDETSKADLLFNRLQDDMIQIVIPSIAVLEFANTLWVKLRQGKANERECSNILTQFFFMCTKMRIVAAEASLFEIFEHSVVYDHAAYDMAFLVLAEQLKAPFVTADEQLYLKARSQSKLPILLRNVD